MKNLEQLVIKVVPADQATKQDQKELRVMPKLDNNICTLVIGGFESQVMRAVMKISDVVGELNLVKELRICKSGKETIIPTGSTMVVVVTYIATKEEYEQLVGALKAEENAAKELLKMTTKK